jgi:hypothetical protein
MLSIEDELDLLETSNLDYLMGEYLLDYFKKDFNERILKNFLHQLNYLIETIEASNSFRGLSISERTAATRTQLSHANENALVDLASRLLDIYHEYEKCLEEHFMRFDVYSRRCSAKQQTFASKREILVYQRAILIEKLNTRHYNLFNLLFKNVFDNYQQLESKEEGLQE